MLNNNRIGYLHFWCQKVLPLVYDNSLSYLEVLFKVKEKLNEVIKFTNDIPEYIDKKFIEAFDEEHLKELISEVFRTIEDAISANNEGTNTHFSTNYPITGTLVWHDNKLYKTMHPIDAGDSVLPDSNIELVNFGDMFDEFLVEVKTRFTSNDDGDRETSSADRPVHDLVWLHNELYEVIKPIAEGNAYIYSGTNKNVEDVNLDKIYEYLLGLISNEIDAREEADVLLQENIDNEATAREEGDGVLQENIGNEATAREEADTGILNKIGDTTNLTTTDKSTVVAAINEVNDNVGEVEETLNDFKNSRNEIVVNVKDFGTYGDGLHDDIDAIESAINSIKNTGGTVFLPAGTYAISHPIRIGDGTARITSGTAIASPSTYNSIRFIGEGCENNGTQKGTTQIVPTAQMESVIYVDGRICNVEISRMILWANDYAAFGLYITSTTHSLFEDIYIWAPTNVGLYVAGGALPTGNYNTFNTFNRINVVLNRNNTVALLMDGRLVDGNTPIINDTWLTSFNNCRFDAIGNVSNAVMGMFKFADNCTFNRCHFVGGDSTCIGVSFSSASNIPDNNYPQAMAFYDCSIKNYDINEQVAQQLFVGKQYVVGAGANDNENLPRTDKIFGFASDGTMIGGFTYSKINSYADLYSAVRALPVGYGINIVTTPEFNNTYLEVNDWLSGHAIYVDDNNLHMMLSSGVGNFYLYFNMQTGTRTAYGRVATS